MEGWDCPIKRIVDETQYNIIKESDKQILQTVWREGINVNKDELIRALEYDRHQYEKGYADGWAARQIDIDILKNEFIKDLNDAKSWLCLAQKNRDKEDMIRADAVVATYEACIKAIDWCGLNTYDLNNLPVAQKQGEQDDS